MPEKVPPAVTIRALQHFGLIRSGPISEALVLLSPTDNGVKVNVNTPGYFVVDVKRGEAQLHLVLPIYELETEMTEMTMLVPQAGAEMKWVFNARWRDGSFSLVLSSNFMQHAAERDSDLWVLTQHLAKCLTDEMICEIVQLCRTGTDYELFGRLIEELAAG